MLYTNRDQLDNFMITKSLVLTAIEFVSLTDEPQLIRVSNGETTLTFVIDGFLWLSAPTGLLSCDAAEELTIEGIGLGRPYWNGEAPPWTEGAFDPRAELKRIEMLQRAAFQLQASGGSMLGM